MMITKALLLIWIGSLDSQAITVTKFETVTECEDALQALQYIHRSLRAGEYVRCIPYDTKEN